MQEHVSLSNAFLHNSTACAKHTRTHVGLDLSDLCCLVIGEYAMGRSLMDRCIQRSQVQNLSSRFVFVQPKVKINNTCSPAFTYRFGVRPTPTLYDTSWSSEEMTEDQIIFLPPSSFNGKSLKPDVYFM